jgi:hypothetical protein
MSNMYGMALARYKAVPDSKMKGLSGLPPLVAFTSEDVSHVHFLFKYGITMKNSTLRNVTPCGSCKNEHFRGMFCPHH